MKVHILMAWYALEGSFIRRIFSSKKKADKILKEIEEHQQKYPDCPEVKDPHELWEAYYVSQKEWSRAHPLDEGDCDGTRYIEEYRIDTEEVL